MEECLALDGTRLQWGEDGQPRSATHGDVYYSTEDGLAETRHVFIGQNDLADRWAELEPCDDFVIGETGFGTGLNFLAAWRLWRDAAPPGARLHFLSVERHPLAREDLARALAAFPELETLAARLIAAWPTAFARGLHRCRFDQGHVSLTLAFDEALAGLEAFLESQHPLHRAPRRGVNAWFLDGFAPARNPDMWRGELLDTVSALSAPGATFATFTAAGTVRRTLRNTGFEVNKVPGFGRKRDMLRGRLVRQPIHPDPKRFPPSPYPDGHPQAWSLDDTNSPLPAEFRSMTRVAVVGAGLAGCHAAAALADRGFNVTLIDAEREPASAGSGNRQGVLYARPTPGATQASRFNLAALLFAQRHYEPLWKAGGIGERCGVLHLALDERDRDKQGRLTEALKHPALCQTLDRASASEAAGFPLPCGGLWYPESGWLSPPVVCRRLLSGSRVERRQARITELAQPSDNAWQLVDDRGQVCMEAELVVLACGTGLAGFDPTRELPVQPVRGQVSEFPLEASDTAHALRLAICAEGYVSPVLENRLSFGASFVPGDTAIDTRPGETEENLDRLRRNVPELVPDRVSPNDCSDRAALRCATPDRLPLVGPVPDVAIMEARFALLRKNAQAAISAPGAWRRGLYVSAGYGSRGLAYIPLATEWLVAHICGEPPPMDGALREALNPARFLIRDLKRNRR
jgi:tRNA 5-methylaminomethyl-2-thiouridine biosynthesis bifunctional protein